MSNSILGSRSRAHCVATVAATFLSSVVVAQGYVGWQLRTLAAAPTPRGGHAMAHDAARGRTLLFGGATNTAPGCCMLGDTWEWDGSTWLQQSPTSSPPPLSGAVAVVDAARQRTVLFGGHDGTSERAETWEWNGTDWQRLWPAVSPPPRALHGMVWDSVRRQTVLFGGDAGGTAFGDTWVFDGTTWTQQMPAVAPPARRGAAMVFDAASGQVVMFGGDGGPTRYADTWTYNGTTWTQRAPSLAPPATWHGAAAFDPSRGRTVLFGGFTPIGPSADLWEWDGATWDRRGPSGPVARYHSALAFRADGEAMLFGGVSGAMVGGFGDTWTLRLAAPARYDAFGSGCAGTAGTPVLGVGPWQAQLPWIGTTFELQIGNVPPSAPLPMLVLGWSNTVYQGQPLPIALDSLGLPGCTLYVSVDEFHVCTRSGSIASCALVVPPAMALLGLHFHAQALVFDPAANPFGATVSNAGTGVVGSR